MLKKTKGHSEASATLLPGIEPMGFCHIMLLVCLPAARQAIAASKTQPTCSTRLGDVDSDRSRVAVDCEAGNMAGVL